MSGKPTIKAVAAHAGVSICTVSRILAGGTRRAQYSSQTRALVEQSAATLSYRPNSSARALQAGVSSAIGILYPDAKGLFGSSLLSAIQLAVQGRDRHTLLLSRGPQGAVSRALEALEEGRIDGLLVLAFDLGEDDLRRLEDANRPVVLLCPRTPSSLPSVVLDPVPGITVATRWLAELGHRRVAWLGPDAPEVSDSLQRTACSAQAAQELGLRWSSWAMGSELRSEDQWIRCAREVVVAALAALPPGEAAPAILCHNDLTALGVYAAAQDLGLRIGRDLSVIGFDDLYGLIAYPTMTSVSHMFTNVSDQATGLLLKRQSGRSQGNAITLSIPSCLMKRMSAGPPAGR